MSYYEWDSLLQVSLWANPNSSANISHKVQAWCQTENYQTGGNTCLHGNCYLPANPKYTHEQYPLNCSKWLLRLEKAPGSSYQSANTLKENVKRRWNQTALCKAQSMDKGHKVEYKKFCESIKKSLFYCNHDQTLEQFVNSS